jgi:hypothetical protein
VTDTEAWYTADLRVGATTDLTSTGLTTTRARIFGTTVTVLHRVDAGEHRRRQQHHTGVLRSLELLDVLFELPAHEAVPLASLTMPTVRVMRAAPPGTVKFTDTTVVRQAIPVIDRSRRACWPHCWASLRTVLRPTRKSWSPSDG